MGFETSSLCRNAIARTQAHEQEAIQRVLTSLRLFRDRAEILAAEIPRFAPGLTDHSVRHLDALWEMADLLAGDRVLLNVAEVFVLGGAILLHDLANAVAAFPNGLNDLRGPQWNDLVHAEFLSRYGRRPEAAEVAAPPVEVTSEVTLARLRQVHAAEAAVLATRGFFWFIR